MEIIQTYAKLDEGSPYMNNHQHLYDPKLNFYSFFLSYLTLKKYYGSVTMFTNTDGYESVVKYIPYDNINIKENENKDFVFWNKYKVDIIKSIDYDFIHVDSDVFLFDDHFRKFIDNDKIDIIVQDIISKNKNFIYHEYIKNKKTIDSNNIGDSSKYDGRCFSCGVIGMRNDIRKIYIEKTDVMYNLIKSGEIKTNTPSMFYEELTAYLLTNKYDWNVLDILPFNLTQKYGVESVGNMMKYTHLWFNSKFSKRNIQLIKNKIKKDFSEDYVFLEKFESNNNISNLGL